MAQAPLLRPGVAPVPAPETAPSFPLGRVLLFGGATVVVLGLASLAETPASTQSSPTPETPPPTTRPTTIPGLLGSLAAPPAPDTRLLPFGQPAAPATPETPPPATPTAPAPEKEKVLVQPEEDQTVWAAFADVFGPNEASAEIRRRAEALQARHYTIGYDGDPYKDHVWRIVSITTPDGKTFTGARAVSRLLSGAL